MAGSRYRKPKKDISTLDPNSQEYWEEILRREGLSMSRGQYPQRLKYGWRYDDANPAHADKASPQSAPSTTRQAEDDYSEESFP